MRWSRACWMGWGILLAGSQTCESLDCDTALLAMRLDATGRETPSVPASLSWLAVTPMPTVTQLGCYVLSLDVSMPGLQSSCSLTLRVSFLSFLYRLYISLFQSIISGFQLYILQGNLIIPFPNLGRRVWHSAEALYGHPHLPPREDITLLIYSWVNEVHYHFIFNLSSCCHPTSYSLRCCLLLDSLIRM